MPLCGKLVVRSDGESREGTLGDSTYVCSFILSVLLTLLTLAELIAIIALPGNDIEVQFGFEIAPPATFPIMIVVALFNLIVTPIAAASLFMGSRKVGLYYFYAALIGLILNLYVFVYLILAGNGAVVTKSRNVNSNNLDGKLEFDELADDTQERLVQFAIDFPEEWKEIQDKFNCCGFNIQTMYGFDLDGFDPIATMHTGLVCPANKGEIDTFVTANPDFDNDVLEDALEEFDFDEAGNFLCEGSLSEAIRQRSLDISILYGIHGFFMLILVFMFGLLIYMFEEKEGGLRANEDSLHATPKVEATVVARARFQSQSRNGDVTQISKASSASAKGKPAQASGMTRLKFN